MSPELQSILDTLQKFGDKIEAETWYAKNKTKIIPLLADVFEEDQNQYTIIIEEIIGSFPHGMKGTKKEIHARVNREIRLRIDARLKDHFPEGEEVILERNKDGLVIKNLPNAVTIILRSKHLHLKYDSFKSGLCFEVCGDDKLPWLVSNDNLIEMKYYITHREKEVDSIKYYNANTSYQKAALKYYLSQFFTEELSWRMFEDALVYAAHQNRINIQQDFFNNGLPEWDFVDRMDVLHRFAGVKDKVWATVVGHSLFVGMMARCYQPGFDYRGVIILEGAQEIGKSLLCRNLAFHKDFYTQFIFDKNNHGYEVSRQLQGMVIVEFPDMGGIGNRDTNYIKAFFTATHDRNRKMNQDLVEHIDRIGIFIVTTNASGPYLNDPTGNTRYLPVFCDTNWIDIDKIREELPMLLAQAKYLWEHGISPILTEAEREIRDAQVKPREMKSDYYYRILPVILQHRDEFQYSETENWDDGANQETILAWCEGLEWWKESPRSKHWSEISMVLQRHFYMKKSQKYIPQIRRRIDEAELTGMKWRFAGKGSWDDLLSGMIQDMKEGL